MPKVTAFFHRDSGGGEMVAQVMHPSGHRWSFKSAVSPHPGTGDPCAVFEVPDEPEVSLRWWWDTGGEGPSEVGCAVVNTWDRGQIAVRGTEPIPVGGPRARYAPTLAAVECEGFAPRRREASDPYGMSDFASGQGD
jgi:hypothetical protein